MKRKKTLFVCLIVLLICMGLSACGGQQNIDSQSPDLGNSGGISAPNSEAGDDGELDNPPAEDNSSSEKDDNDSSSSVDSGGDSSNDSSSSGDEWIDIVFPRM